MSAQTGSGITVEKTLHMENAFVQSIHYTSISRPVLEETIAVGGRSDHLNGRCVETGSIQPCLPETMNEIGLHLGWLQRL